MITGEPEPVRRVFNQAILLEKVRDDNEQQEQFLVSLAADSSFKSNCTQHERIREFARQWQKETNLKPTAEKLLQVCIEAQAGE